MYAQPCFNEHTNEHTVDRGPLTVSLRILSIYAPPIELITCFVCCNVWRIVDFLYTPLAYNYALFYVTTDATYMYSR